MRTTRLIVTLLALFVLLETFHIEPTEADLEMLAFKLLKKAWRKKYKKKFKQILAIPIPIFIKKKEEEKKYEHDYK